ncbi:CAAX prenyl protease-like protein [Kribbella sp. VKM Ac-2568]|nr:CAAX prenyl protease-like protein [Kribbella sp. VKM Ac-2568]
MDLGEFLGSKEYPNVGWELVLIEVIFFGCGEESGWRGYALDALRADGRTAYAASTVLAIFWAGWHLPLFFYAHGLATLSPLLVPGWLVSLLFGSYLTTWLYRSSRDCLWWRSSTVVSTWCR